MSQQIQITGGAKVRALEGVITGTSGVLDALPINGSLGIPQLDVNGKILVSQLPNSVMEYQGTWNVTTNTPYLVDGVGNQGDVYIVTNAASTGTAHDFGSGSITFFNGDQAIYSGTIWQRASGATGTVTSVGLSTDGNSLTIGNSPITTSGTITANFAGTNLQYINGAGNLTTFPTLISSIGLSMPSAFSVANSPLTANGTIAVTGAGYPSQYIRGDGTLADFPTSGGGGSSVSYYLNGGTSQGTIGGVTYYEMSKTADTGTGVDFPLVGDGLIVSFLTDAGDPAQLNIPAGNWNYEIYASMSSNGGTPQMYAELYVYNGTTFTLISTSSNEILYDGVNLNLYTFAMTVPATTLALTDRLAIKLYSTNSGGKTTTVHTQDSHLCQVITTFSTGITALNGLTAQVQYFATGTSGTDFAISSSTATHTFNLPTASATNRGALSSANWSTFNSKQDAISLTTTGTTGAATFISNTLNIPDYTYTLPTATSSILGGVKIGSGVTITSGVISVSTNYQAPITLTTTGSSGSATFVTNTLNVPAYTLSGLGGQPLATNLTSLSGLTYASTSFVKMTASGTFALDTTAYGTGSVTSVAALTLGTTGTDLSSTVATGTTTPVITLNVPDASATARGVITTGTQTIAGAKTFSGATVFSSTTSHTGTATFGAGSPTAIDGTDGTLIIPKIRLYASSSPATKYNNIVSAATQNRDIVVPDASGTLALTSDLSGYLPLTGGTLSGSLQVGSPSATNTASLAVTKTITGSVNSRGILSDGVIQSGVTDSAYYFQSKAYTAAGSYTIALLTHYMAEKNQILNTQVTTQVGFYANNTLGTNTAGANYALNNYGFFGNLSITNAYSTNYNLYMNGSAYNYLYGLTGIGAVPSGVYNLEVTGTTLTTGIATFNSALNGVSSYFTSLIKTDNAVAFKNITSGGTAPSSLAGYSQLFFDTYQLAIRKADNQIIYLRYPNSATTQTWDLNVEGYIAVQYTASQTTGGVSFIRSTGHFTQDATNFFWDNTNKRLGIGTNAPLKTLDVNGEIYIRGWATFNSTDANGWYSTFNSSGTAFAYMGSTAQFAATGGTATDFGIRSQNAIAFYTNGGNERMRISSTGAATFSSSVTAASATFYSASGTIMNIYSDNATTDNILLVRGNSGSNIGLAVKGSSNVGIGTSSPDASDWNASARLLHIYQNTTNGSVIKLESSNASGVIGVGNDAMQLGTITSDPLLFFTATTEKMRISSAGVVTITGLGTGTVSATGGVLSTVSDMNLKVEDGFIDNALGKVMNLKPRYFHWKEESGLPTDLRQLGFFAQEVNEALGEEAANTPKTENDKWGIYDRGIIAMLTKAIQEQNQTITSLQEQINELKNK